jgi:NADH dehydrogenase/NADH:ubiquinone oxidoreductase subunit G
MNPNFYSLNIIKKLYFFIGMSILNRLDSFNILGGFLNLFNQIHNFSFDQLNILPRFLGRISSYEVSALPGIRSMMTYNGSIKKSINHYCGIDFDTNHIYYPSKKNINIYQGSFYINIFIKYIWLIIPVNLYTETFMSYLNLEGRYRPTQKAITPKTVIYSDWKIFQILFFVKKILLKNNFSIINNFYLYLNYFKTIINYFYLDYIQKKFHCVKLFKNFNIKFLSLSLNLK